LPRKLQNQATQDGSSASEPVISSLSSLSLSLTRSTASAAWHEREKESAQPLVAGPWHKLTLLTSAATDAQHLGLVPEDEHTANGTRLPVHDSAYYLISTHSLRADSLPAGCWTYHSQPSCCCCGQTAAGALGQQHATTASVAGHPALSWPAVKPQTVKGHLKHQRSHAWAAVIDEQQAALTEALVARGNARLGGVCSTQTALTRL